MKTDGFKFIHFFLSLVGKKMQQILCDINSWKDVDTKTQFKQQYR